MACEPLFQVYNILVTLLQFMCTQLNLCVTCELHNKLSISTQGLPVGLVDTWRAV
jgi:hypothetical protein